MQMCEGLPESECKTNYRDSSNPVYYARSDMLELMLMDFTNKEEIKTIFNELEYADDYPINAINILFGLGSISHALFKNGVPLLIAWATKNAYGVSELCMRASTKLEEMFDHNVFKAMKALLAELIEGSVKVISAVNLDERADTNKRFLEKLGFKYETKLEGCGFKGVDLLIYSGKPEELNETSTEERKED